jgi:hypothetical protein
MSEQRPVCRAKRGGISAATNRCEREGEHRSHPDGRRDDRQSAGTEVPRPHADSAKTPNGVAPPGGVRRAMLAGSALEERRGSARKGDPEVLSQISILGAKSENRVSEIQWLTDSKPLEKANLRQSRMALS